MDDTLNLDDLLKDYVGDEAGESERARPVSGGEENIENILSAYLDEGGSTDRMEKKASPKGEPDDSLDDVLQSFLDSDLEN